MWSSCRVGLEPCNCGAPELEVKMQSRRDVKERWKRTASICDFLCSARLRGRWPRGAGAGLAIVALSLALGLAGVRAFAANNHSAPGASCMSAAQLLSQVASEPAATVNSQQQTPAVGASHASAPLTLTLQDALERAEKYSPQFQAAVTATRMARANVTQARSALLPSADANVQELLTQGNG